MKEIIKYSKLIDDTAVKLSDWFVPKNKLVKNLILFLLFLTAIHFFYDYVGIYQYIHYRPCSIHSWAQCQRASIAQCYYEESMNFFLPRVQKYTPEGGITGMEFPIIYYTGAVMYKLFGFNEMYLRLVSLLIVTFGFFFCSLAVNKFLKNYIFSLCITGSAFFSPVLLFYTPNFMPDAPSIAFILIAWYFLFQYMETPIKRYLFLFVFFATLGSLLKVVSLMCFVVVLMMLALDKLKLFKNHVSEYKFHNHKKIALAIVIGIIFVTAWYIYARWLAINYKNETFALAFIKGDLSTLTAILNNLKTEERIYSIYSNETYVLLITALLFLVAGAAFINRFLFSITFLYFMGSICYAYLFLTQFINHDYYIIAFIPGLVFLLLTFADGISRLSKKYSVLIKIAVIILLIFNMKESIRNCRYFYDYRYNEYRVYSSTSDRSYYDLEKRLRTAGVKRTDITLSGFDNTFCSSLYLMDQIGMVIPETADKDQIEYLMDETHAKYLILNDSARFNAIYPNHFDKKILLTHRGVIVYKLR